jgi:hypothetical protein
MNEEYIYLLKDEIYLYLLAFYNLHTRPTYVQLAEELKMTRQTISTKFKNLLNTNIILLKKEKGKQILVIKNPLEINVKKIREYFEQNNNYIANYQDFIYYINDYCYNNRKQVNNRQIIKKLKMSKQTYYNHKEAILYGIIYENELKYIGQTYTYKHRIHQHISNRPFLSEENFIILKKDIQGDPHEIERYLIEVLNPEWNIMNKIDFN